MKRLTAILALIILLAPISVALSRGGNFTYILDQRWKREQAFQKRQDEKFKRLEREADRAMVSPNPARNVRPRGTFRNP
ncbi:MAG: hypothetical protein WBG50_22515 [Desulfomonilaceae bacterium]